MKGMTAFSRISDVSEYLIEESLELFEQKAAAPAPKPQSAFSRFMNSGWGVAAVCALVSVFVMGGIIWASFNPPSGRPDDPVTETQEETVIETEPENESEIQTTDESEPEPEEVTTEANGGWPGGTFLIVRRSPDVIALGELNTELGVEEIGLDAGKLRYDVEVFVKDPEIVELVSVDKYAIFDSGIGDVALRGLKEGSTTLILKYIYKPTGAWKATIIPITVEKPAEREDETTAFVDTSDVWEVFFTETHSKRVYTVKEGETFDRFYVEFRCVDCRNLWHPTNCSYDGVEFRYEDYRIDATTPNEGVVEVLSCDKYAIMNTCDLGGITVKGLREGTTPLLLTLTHIPTGKTVTAEATVVVMAASDS